MADGVLARWGIALVVSIVVPVGLAAAGAAQWLGAHPWWDVKTALIGAPVGAVIALVMLPLPAFWRGVVGGIVLAVAGISAWQGKVRFAESFAEDARAGQFWYFGWIGVAAGLALLIAAVLAPSRR